MQCSQEQFSPLFENASLSNFSSMKQSGKNRSNHVFKRFFRSRVSAVDSGLTATPQTQLSNTNSKHSTQFKNIETGEPEKKQNRCGPLNIFVVWDSPFSLKLLGSKSAIEKEEIRRRSLHYFIVHPCCRFRCICCYYYNILHTYFPVGFIGIQFYLSS